MFITGYKLAQVVNIKLSEMNIKEIPTQMIYNYMKNQMIEFEVVEGKKVIDVEVAKVWMKKFISGRKEVSTTMQELLSAFNDDEEEVESI